MRKKRISIIFSLLLVFAFILTAVNSVVAEGIDHNNQIGIEVITDKEKYKQHEEVNYDVKVSNLSVFKANDIVVKMVIPEGLEIIKTEGKIENENLLLYIDSIEGQGEITLSFIAKLADSGADVPIVDPIVEDGTGSNAGKDSFPPQTSDNTNIFIYVVLLLISLALLGISVGIYKKKYKKEKVGKAVVLLLLLSFIASISLFSVANANEGNKTTEKKHRITIEEKVYETIFTIESVQYDLPDLSLTFISPDDFDELGSFSTEQPTLFVNYLSWNEIGEADSYTVKKRANNGSYEILADALTETTFIDAEIEEGNTYQYIVEAVYNGSPILVSNDITQLAAPLLQAEMDKDV